MADATDQPSPVDQFLRRRKVLRRISLCALLLIVSSIIVANFWTQARGGDDWSRFDRKYFIVQSVMSGDQIAIESADGRTAETVRLLGIDAPEMAADGHAAAHGSLESYQALRELAQGRRVMLGLPSLAPRTHQGLLRAYVYLDGDPPTLSVNERLITDGHAYADRRSEHPFHKQFDQAEGEARRKKRGLWAGVRDDQQPQWRQQWIKSLWADGVESQE